MAEAQILRVTTLADENDGSAEAGQGLSLRDAVIIANNTPGDKIIELEAGQTYNLTLSGDDLTDEGAILQADLDISSDASTGNLTIRGAGATINANQVGRVFHVFDGQTNGTTFTVENVTLTGGEANDGNGGGGIFVENSGIVVIDNVDIAGNTAPENNGGGIANEGTVTITNSRIEGNSAIEGGAIHATYATTRILDSTISNNSASRNGGGFRDENSVLAEIVNSTITNNNASLNGGGLSSQAFPSITGVEGSISIRDSLISGNTANNAGGIHSDGGAESFDIENSTIENNTANNQGGGIGIGLGTQNLNLFNSNVRNNQAGSNGGGIYTASNLTLDSSIISGNTADGDGGGIDSAGYSRIFNSTIDGNTSNGTGGGLRNVEVVVNSIISNNQAANFGGGLFTISPGVIIGSTINDNNTKSSGGGIFAGATQTPDRLAIANSTISGNTAQLNGGGIGIAATHVRNTPNDTNPDVAYNVELINNGGDITAINVTITNNIADSNNDGEGEGGGVFNSPSFISGNSDPTAGIKNVFASGKFTASNTILAGNFDTPDNNGNGNIYADIAGAARGNANNLIGNTEGVTLEENIASETESLGRGSDLTGVDPRLGVLQNNGGITPTHALLSDSLALNGGDNNNIPQENFGDLNNNGNSFNLDFNGDGDSEDAIDTDQRGAGFERIVGNNVDIGAFEFNPSNENGNRLPVDFNDDVDNTVYRFFNQDTGVHFYTANPNERDFLLEANNFSFEGASYTAVDPLSGMPVPVPVYRFFNQDTGVHLYTISPIERDATQELDNFIFEGEAFFAYETEVEGSIPIYRFFNSTTGAHFYTPSEVERNNAETNLPNFEAEGIAYYALPNEI